MQIGDADPTTLIYDLGYGLVMYVLLAVYRGIVMYCVIPLFRNGHYGYDWKDALICTWGGLRGDVSLALAVAVYSDNLIRDCGAVGIESASYSASDSGSAGGLLNCIPEGERVKQVCLLHVCLTVLLTLVFNASTCGALLRNIGMTQLPPEKVAMVQIASEILQKQKIKLYRKLSTHLVFAHVRWPGVERITDIPGCISNVLNEQPELLLEAMMWAPDRDDFSDKQDEHSNKFKNRASQPLGEGAQGTLAVEVDSPTVPGVDVTPNTEDLACNDADAAPSPDSSSAGAAPKPNSFKGRHKRRSVLTDAVLTGAETNTKESSAPVPQDEQRRSHRGSTSNGLSKRFSLADSNISRVRQSIVSARYNNSLEHIQKRREEERLKLLHSDITRLLERCKAHSWGLFQSGLASPYSFLVLKKQLYDQVDIRARFGPERAPLPISDPGSVPDAGSVANSSSMLLRGARWESRCPGSRAWAK